MLPPRLSAIKSRLDTLSMDRRLDPELEALQAELGALDAVLVEAVNSSEMIRNLARERLPTGMQFLGPTPGVCPGCGRAL